MENDKLKNEQAKDNIVLSVVSGSFDIDKLKSLIQNIYLQGWLDRDWGIGQDAADEKAAKYSAKKILELCRKNCH